MYIYIYIYIYSKGVYVVHYIACLGRLNQLPDT